MIKYKSDKHILKILKHKDIVFICKNHHKYSLKHLSIMFKCSVDTIYKCLKLNNIKKIRNSIGERCYQYKYTDNIIFETAKKYACRKDFKKYDYKIYAAASNRQIITKACSHMSPQGTRISKLVYLFKFKDDSIYVGITYNFNVRFKEHKKKLLKGKIIKTVLLTKLLPLKEALELEEKTRLFFIKKGIKVWNKIKCGASGGAIFKYSDSQIKKEALLYKTRVEWCKKSTNIYYASIRRGIHKECCEHMKYATKKEIVNITTGELFDSVNSISVKYKINRQTVTRRIKNNKNINNHLFKFIEA